MAAHHGRLGKCQRPDLRKELVSVFKCLYLPTRWPDISELNISAWGARVWEFDSLLGLLGERPAWLALGEMRRPMAHPPTPEKGKGKPFLRILYLENPPKGGGSP